MATGGLEGGGGSGGYGGGGRGRDLNDGYGATVSVPFSESGGVGTCGIPGRTAGGRVHTVGGGSDIQGGRVLPHNQPSVGGMEGGGGDPQLPPRHLH